MVLAGVPVSDELVVELAEILTFAGLVDTARRILHAHADGREIGLTTDEREGILRALEDPPARLQEFRAVLLQEHVKDAAAA